MKKGSLLKRSLSFVMVFAVLLSLAAPASAAVAKLGQQTYGYVAIGDAMTEGIGLNDAGTEAYYAKVAEYLGTKPTSVANKRYRIEEIRYLLDDSYAGDGYTASIGGINTDRKTGELKDYVRNAEVISINVGVNNFSTYLVSQMVYYLENNGAVKYSYDFSAFTDDSVSAALENVQEAVMDRLLAATPGELEDSMELINFVSEVSAYTYMSYVTSFNAVIREIYALNPDVDLYVVGIYNAMEGDVLTLDASGRTVEVPIGSAFGALVELANIYTQVLAPRAYDYTYVDPGTPELLIDQMGNTSLKPEDRIPTALKHELLNSVETTAISMVQEMFAQYGIAKTENEAYAIAEEIFEKNSADRRDYIKSLIQDFAVDEVIDRFKTELENYAGTYGSITVTTEQIKTLLDNLDDATSDSDRKEVATEFVVDLMTKAMIGQTFAGIQINTQQDAYDAIDLLERNSQGDPDALREAAADMIMTKVGDNGLKDFITRDDVLDLLEQMDTTTSDAEREVIIDEWMNDLAVKKITDKIQTVNPAYKESDAKALLAAMQSADEADREAIAKNHLLTTGGFHAYMVTKFEQTYTDNGLTLQTYASFEAFVSAVEQADTNAAAKAIVRGEIRAAAANKVVTNPTCQNLMADLTQPEVITMFQGMDNAADKDAYMLSWLCDRLNTPNPNQLQLEFIINPMKNVFIGAYNSYNDAATVAEEAFAEYRDGVDTAAEGFAQYVSLKDTAAQQILDAYNAEYQGAGETALKYYADYISLRDQAVAKVLDGYAEYNRAVNLGLDTVDQFNMTFENVFNQLRNIAEVESISLNHLAAVAKKLDANYVQSMVENLVQGDPLAAEDKTVAYIALRYYLANAMMIMPSAKGHATIADRIITAIKNGASVNSAAGSLANKVINTGADIYHCAAEFISLPTGASGQASILRNPETYVAFGDNVTSGTALSSGSKTYVELIADALAMDYIYEDVDAEDNVYNYALNGMRAEELLALVKAGYNGDAYTEARFGAAYLESLRKAYAENIKNADLITINVGINNLTTFPLEQILLAYNGQETYEMDWARYVGESRANKLSKGKDAVTDLILAIVDNAESRIPMADGLSAYDKAERALNTVSTAIESVFYGLLGYAVNLDDAVESIATMNREATIVLIGFYNPMEGTYFNVERTAELKGHELDLSDITIDVSALFDKVINISNRFLTNYVQGDDAAAVANSRMVAVPVLNTELGVTDTGASKDLSTLTTWKTVSVKGHEIDILVPEYFVYAGKNVGVNLHPNADGHAYIASKVINALKFEIHANVILGQHEKYYGDADPDFGYIVDDLSSLYGEDAIVLDIFREDGESVGEYLISAEVSYDGYTSVIVTCGTLTILPRPVTITVNPADTTIEVGGTIPNYTATVTDYEGKEVKGLRVSLSGVPADSNTIGTYTITATFTNSNYVIETVNNAVLVIGEKAQTPVNIQVLLSQDTIKYGDSLPTASVIVTDEDGNVIEGLDVVISGMPEDANTLGVYTVTATLADNDRYVVASVANATLTIEPKPVTVTVTPDSAEIYLNGQLPGFTVTVTDEDGNVITEGFTANVDLSQVNTGVLGTYDVTVDFTSDVYEATVINGATVTVKFDFSNASITSHQITLNLDGQVFMRYGINLIGFEGSNINFEEKGGVVIWVGDQAPTSRNQLQVNAENCVTKPSSMTYSEVFDRYQVTSLGINAPNYGDEVYMRAYVEVAPGEYVYGPAGHSSPEKYCKEMLSRADVQTDVKETCASLLNYGAAAQMLFDYKLDKLVTNGVDLSGYNLDFDQNMIDPIDRPTAEMANTLTGIRSGVGSATATLSLQAALVLKTVYPVTIPAEEIDRVELLVWTEEDYNNADTLAYDANTYSYVVDMTPGTLVGVTGYVAEFNPTAVMAIGDTFYFSCRVIKTNGDVHRSGLSFYNADKYINDMQNNSDPEVAAVVKALAVYSQKARILFSYKLDELN